MKLLLTTSLVTFLFSAQVWAAHFRLQTQWTIHLPTTIEETYSLNQFQSGGGIGYTVSHSLGSRVIQNRVITQKIAGDLLKLVDAAKNSRTVASLCSNRVLLREIKGKAVRTYMFCPGSHPNASSPNQLVAEMKKVLTI